MNIEDAQQDMRNAYVGGATGVFASALAWLASAAVASGGSPTKAVLTLFAAGMFIYPASILLAKILGRSGSYRRGNRLAPLAMESTAPLIFGLPIAYVVSLYKAQFFYPAMMLIIGGRYCVFSSLYGMRIYWVLGAALAAAAYLLVLARASMPAGGFLGAGLEAIFSVLIYLLAGTRRPNPSVERASLSPLRGSKDAAHVER